MELKENGISNSIKRTSSGRKGTINSRKPLSHADRVGGFYLNLYMLWATQLNLVVAPSHSPPHTFPMLNDLPVALAQLVAFLPHSVPIDYQVGAGLRRGRGPRYQ